MMFLTAYCILVMLTSLTYIQGAFTTKFMLHRPSSALERTGNDVLSSSTFILHRRTGRMHQTRLSMSTSEIKTLIPPQSNQFYIQEEEVKKSRFIGIAAPCSSWDEARIHLEQVRKDHPKSRHVCFGFVSGGCENSVVTERCSDDGEPTGTAVSFCWVF